MTEPPRPPAAVSSTRAARQAALAAWHAEWFARQVASGVDGPVPADRPVPSDYNVHFPDIEAPGAAQDEFHVRAREIMGLPAQEA